MTFKQYSRNRSYYISHHNYCLPENRQNRMISLCIGHMGFLKDPFCQGSGRWGKGEATLLPTASLQQTVPPVSQGVATVP